MSWSVGFKAGMGLDLKYTSNWGEEGRKGPLPVILEQISPETSQRDLHRTASCQQLPDQNQMEMI